MPPPMALLLTAACLLTYANGLTGGFTYDDKAVVRDDPRIQSLARLPEIFTTNYFGGRLETGQNYRPLDLLSLTVDYALFGKWPLGYHVVNLALHVADTLLLVAVLAEWGFSETVAGAAGLLFAVAPIHVEAVTSIVGRAELLSALFVLLMLRFAGRGRVAGASVFYLFSVLAKESAAVAPGLLFLLDAFREEGSFARRVGRLLRRQPLRYLIYGLPLGIVLAVRFVVLKGVLIARAGSVFELENPLVAVPPLWRIGNAAVIEIRYLGRTLFPFFLSADESAWALPRLAPHEALFWAALAALALLLLASVAFFRRRPGVAFGVLFFALAGLSTANYFFITGTIMAERLMYLPSAGLFIASAAVGFGRWPAWERVPRSAAVLLAVAVVLLAARTVVRNAVWESDETLFASMLSSVPGSAKGHYDFAYAEADRRKDAAAYRHYARATQIFDDYYDAWAGRGRVAERFGRFGEAVDCYGKSVKIFPSYENGYFGQAEAEQFRGDFDAALGVYRRGLGKDPDAYALQYHEAALLMRLGRLPQAVRAYRRAIVLAPDSALNHYDLAGVLLALGKRKAAVDEIHRALAILPRYAEALRLLAEVEGKAGGSCAAAPVAVRVFEASGAASDLIVAAGYARGCPSYEAVFARSRAAWQKRHPALFQDPFVRRALAGEAP
jgi:protein O-mannosyl-transferase